MKKDERNEEVGEWNGILHKYYILVSVLCKRKESRNGMKWTGTKIRRKQQLDEMMMGVRKERFQKQDLFLFCSLTRHDLTVSSSCFGYSSGQGTGIWSLHLTSPALCETSLSLSSEEEKQRKNRVPLPITLPPLLSFPLLSSPLLSSPLLSFD